MRNLNVFKKFGFENYEKVDENNVVGRCPFCAKEKHFFIHAEKKLWNCKKCGKEGGYQKFLQEVNTQCMIPEKTSLGIGARLTALSNNRGIQKETFRHFEIGIHPVTAKYILPVWNQDHTILHDLATYDIGEQLLNAPGSNVMLYNIWNLFEDGEIWLCGGQFDTWAMHEILEGKDNCLGSPGETTFKRDWLSYFSTRVVNIIYDQDEAGTLGMNKVEHLLKDIPGQRKYIHWAKSFPGGGYDVRDLYKKYKFNKKITLGVLKSMLRDKPPKCEKKTFSSINNHHVKAEIFSKPFPKDFRIDPMWLAKYFIKEQNNNCVFNNTNNTWYIYNDKYWEKDILKDMINKLYDLLCNLERSISVNAGNLPEDVYKEFKKAIHRNLMSKKLMDDILILAQSVKCASTIDELFDRQVYEDKDKNGDTSFLINLNNKTYDLKADCCYDHKKENYLTKILDYKYDPKAKCLRWEKFIREVLCDDKELINFIQQLVGYCLTGDSSEQYLFFLYGSGANGKSIFMRVLDELLGSYYRQSPSNLLMTSASKATIRTDIADLKGYRVTATSETSGRRTFDPVLIKTLTGGDKVSERHLWAGHINFVNRTKIFVIGNQKPKIQDNGHAIWRRMCLIPFLHRVSKAEHETELKLMRQFKKELPGILNWAIEGYRNYVKQGSTLQFPRIIKEATDTYEIDSDKVLRFLTERCLTGETVKKPSQLSVIHEAYRKWCSPKKYMPIGLIKFREDLESKEYRKYNGGNNVTYMHGVEIR